MAEDPASSEQPQNALGGMVGVQTASGPPASIEIRGLVLCSSNLTGKIAEAIDIQLDDGKPGTGTLRAYYQPEQGPGRPRLHGQCHENRLGGQYLGL